MPPPPSPPKSASPTPSTTRLPILGTAPPSRRGSLASLKSTGGKVNRDVLAQALDEIHTTASKSEALTSFHDYDGGPSKGPKEVVSNGVTGLYDKLKRGLSIPASPAVESSRDAYDRAKSMSAASTDATRAETVKSPTAAKQNNGLGVRGDDAEPAASMGNGHSNDSTILQSPLRSSSRQQNGPSSSSKELAQPTTGDVELARDALRGGDQSSAATDALAKVLSHHDSAGADNIRKEEGPSRTSSQAMLPPTYLPSTNQPPHTNGSAVAGGSDGRTAALRPPLPRIGPSHLPGYQPSRTSSTDGGYSSSQATATGSNQRTLQPSPNLNIGLQRQRSDMHPPPRPVDFPDQVPSNLRRRVISKDFWMKDENARVCFHCGQPFSTFRRKHHCRTCGQIFDAKCTNLVPGRPFGQPGTIRLCLPCEDMVIGNDDDSSVYSDDGMSVFERSPIVGRRSFGAHENDLRGIMDGLDDRRNEATTPSIGIPVSRRNRESNRRSAVIEFDAGPVMQRPASSHSLVSLARRPRSSSHRRFHSRTGLRNMRSAADERVPFQPGSLNAHDQNSSLPAFHNDNVIDPDLAAFLSDDGSDDGDQTSIFATLGGAGDGGHPSPGLFATTMRKGRSRHNATAGSSVRGNQEDDALYQATKQLPKLSRHRHPSMNSISLSRPSPRRTRSQTLNVLHPDGHDRKLPPPLIGQEHPATGAQCTRSSAMRGRDAEAVELAPASLRHIQRLLSQLLKDFEIPNPGKWRKALMPILLKCTNDVDPHVDNGDHMDIRNYIKLKKVPGGHPGDTSYISGIVFSKNVPLKTMPRSIPNPRIAIVTFAIEYTRSYNRYMSLDPVIAQEKEYLHNLVGQIAALQPHVLLVQRNVSGAALELLHAAGITVAYNIKDTVLAAVGRVTRTNIIKSVDQLSLDRGLGSCGSFDLKTYIHDGARKTYIYLSGCVPDLGCTIVLRGADTRTLRRVKRVTEFMCYVAYNLKLETSLLRDELLSIPTDVGNHLAASDERRESIMPGKGTMGIAMGFGHGESLLNPELQAASGETPSKYEQMEQAWRTRILSASPFVVFMQPYLLTQLRDSERRLTAYKNLRDQYAAADEAADDDEKASEQEFAMVKPEMVHAPPSKDQPKAIRDYLLAVHQVQYDKTMHTYETQRRLMDSFMSGEIDPFDPFSHQTIVVLHSVVSTINSAPCQGPVPIAITFYAGWNHVEQQFEEDCTLGQYVEDQCRSAENKCKVCEKKMLDHHRQYVHGYGQLSFSVAKPPPKISRFEDREIFMWSACRICEVETPTIPMSENTWKYSFAKYLELSFWSSPLHPSADICEHDIHKDFIRHFGFEDHVVKVQYEPVEIYDVVVPRATITWKVESDLAVKNEQFTHFVKRLNLFTDSVTKRLNSIRVDTLEDKKSAEANEYLAELRQRVKEDHHELLRKLQQKYGDSRYYELIPLNRALRFMDEKALEWDEVFNQIEQDYFPSETDIRRLAAIQLKDMFLASQPTSSNAASDTSDDEESGTESKPVMGRSRTAPLSGRKILRGEKAHDVLSSAVEEHRGNIEELQDVEAIMREESPDKLGEGLKRNVSPREGQEQVVEREEVRHLDLAVLGESLDQTSTSPTSENSKQKSSRPTSSESQATGEPFATQPKPMGSGLLERIEQIRNTRGSSSEQEIAESKIPRLADLQKQRDISPRPSTVAPPLLRAQSSPTSPQHSPKRSADLNSEHSIDSVANGNAPSEPAQTEKRLGDKFGVGRLANKVGKVAPSLIPRSVPQKDDSHNTRVSTLARHFEQMSREFEKERLRDRKQRAQRSRQARANPLASSQPVVEVYRNATDAVGERTADAARSAKPEAVPQLPIVSSDEMVDGQDGKQGEVVGPRKSMTEGDELSFEADQQANETEPRQTRSRDTSDLSSTAVPTLMSPSTMPDLELQTDLPITEAKKSQWFRYLTDFWSERSASGWSQLEYPLHATEHVFEDSDIIVREDEPSSVIALSLACADYRTKVEEFRKKKPAKQQQAPSLIPSVAPPSNGEEEPQQDPIETSLLTDTATHMKYAFAHGPVKASCKIFYAESFDALRRRCGVADRFVESLSRCYKYDSKGGKTKSLFLRTLDERFIIKSLQEVELKAFTKFAPDYFAFMGHTLFHGVPSVIAKMFGLFQVSIKNPATGLDFSYYLLVMENLFYERNPSRRFDLKGSMRNRKIESTGQPDEVLLDENLVEMIFESPLFVREHARRLLRASIWNDTMWLCKQNVMDYSLMAGFDDERKELIVGIIDCIRTYTWDKKLESWIKDRGKNKPTITSPKDYRKRFRASMMEYILQAPNCWHQFQAQMAPPKTLKEREEKDDVVEMREEKVS